MYVNPDDIGGAIPPMHVLLDEVRAENAALENAAAGRRPRAARELPPMPQQRAVDPVQEYRLQLGEEIRGFLVNQAANEGRLMIGDAQIMRTMPLTQMRGIYNDMLDRGYRRI